LPTPAKEKVVEDLAAVFGKATSAVLANYQGISASELTAIRVHLKSRSLDFRVIKNTLAQKAAKDTPFEILESDFNGPVSLLISYDDPIAPAKALADYAKTKPEKNPEILCGLMDGKKLSPEEVKAISSLPSKEVLISQMLSVFKGPTTQFVGVFGGLLRKLVGTLDAVKDKKEQG
jgi:large subunit ribosomal protein L10